VSAVAGVAWWLRPAPSPPRRPTTPAAIPVVADTAQKGDVDITLNGLGTVTSLATVNVRTQINGQLTDVPFKEGQLVKKGDLLAQIDPRPYEAALKQAQGQFTRDQGLLNQAQMDLKRYQSLTKSEAIPRQTYEDQFYIVKQYEGALQIDQGLIDAQNLNITYCHIVSPLDGLVGLRLVDPGNYIQTTENSNLAVITQLKPITVIFTVPEDEVPQILKRLRANATLPVTAFDRSGNTRLATGMLTTTDSQIDPTTGTLRLKASFPNEDEGLFPNQFVNVQLLVDVLHGATVVPTSAIQRGAPGAFVYLINADGTVAARPVELGPGGADRVAVRSGLTPGDRVVVDGADQLRDGARITLRNAHGAAPAPTHSVPAPSGQRHRSQGGTK
jgi:multidrug efflux system membrane fusion protein